jgi:Alkylmercury lyase
MKVELLYFDGCPSYEALLPRLRSLLAEAGVPDDVELRRVETEEEAVAERFLGSPTLRVDGVDVEPGAGTRDDFGLKCRLFFGPAGLVGVPDEAWIRAGIVRDGPAPAHPDKDASSARVTEAPAAVLERIGIGASRAICCRTGELDSGQARLHRRILEAFATSGQCDPRDVKRWQAEGGTDVVAALDALETADLIGRDNEGRIVTAYPFSARPTAHRVVIDGGAGVWAMCAIDALGIPFMVGQSATVHTFEPGTGTAVEIAIDPVSDGVDAHPSGAVAVVAGNGSGSSAECACPYINVFATPEAARNYLADRGDLAGDVVALDQAAQAGQMLFGDLLGATSDAVAPERECC